MLEPTNIVKTNEYCENYFLECKGKMVLEFHSDGLFAPKKKGFMCTLLYHFISNHFTVYCIDEAEQVNDTLNDHFTLGFGKTV